MKGKGISLT